MSAGTCRECKRQMRASHIRVEHAPGTVRRRCKGQCVPCYELSKVRKSRAGKPRYTPDAEANYAHNRAGLVAYLQDRRRRGIKEDGTMQCLENV